MLHKVSLAQDFSLEPYGRFRRDDPLYSGEVFREEVLAPKLREFEKVEVNLDGTFGILPSFLDEAFGGLVRYEGFSSEQLHLKLTIISDEDPTYFDDAWNAIDTSSPVER